jgi:serine protease Do
MLVLIAMLVFGQTSGAYLGAFLGDVTEARAKDLKLDAARGAFVGKVVPGSPADKAGLRENDAILTFNHEQVDNASEVYRLLGESAPGRAISLGVSRAGALRELVVIPGDRARSNGAAHAPNPYAEADGMREEAERLRQDAEEARRKEQDDRAQKLTQESEAMAKLAEETRVATERLLKAPRGGGGVSQAKSSRTPLGLNVAALTPQLGEFFRLNGASGVLVTEVRAESSAARAGLRAGDCIVLVNGTPVKSPEELFHLVESSKDKAELKVIRDGAGLSVSVSTQ